MTKRSLAGSKKKTLPGKLLMTLFGLPFAGFGSFMGYSAFGDIADVLRMQSWVEVSAELHDAGYRTSRGDDSDTYEAYASYTYEFSGERYTGSRVAIAGGADNIGSFQRSLGSRLKRAQQSKQPITVFVNPDEPSEAIVDRSLRWGMIGFKSIFIVLFGGIGFALLIYVWFFSGRGTKELPAAVQSQTPWLANKAWQDASISSGNKGALIGTWVFAIFWSLVSAPLPFAILDELKSRDNPAALIGILFPVIGIFLIVFAIRQTLRWRKFGASPVQLDPFPGSIGGHVGGSISIAAPYQSSTQFTLTLSCLHSAISGSGKSRRRSDTVVWQDTQQGKASLGSQGSVVQFRFDVPEGLPESDAKKSNSSYNHWQLRLNAQLQGPDLEKIYSIPVYPTNQESLSLSKLVFDRAAKQQRSQELQQMRDRLNQTSGGSRELYFPAFRHLGGGFGGIVFGAIFAAVGLFLWQKESGFIGGFISVVTLVIGAAVALSGLYYLGNSLHVTQQGGAIRSVRRWFGLPIKRRSINRADVVALKKKTTSKSQSGSKHTVYYRIVAVDAQGEEFPLGDQFKGARQAEAAMQVVAERFNLPQASAGSVARDNLEHDHKP